MSAILRREARNSSSPVLLDPVPQIARHSDVQAARPASKNVDAVVAIHRMPQEWTQPSRETAMREDDPSAFLSLPLPCPCLALSFALFFTLSSRTASCADALRDLLFAWLSSSPFSFRCHPERGAFCRRGTCCSLLPLPAPVFTLSSRARLLFADEGPAVRFCLCPLLSLRCHPERGCFLPTRDLLFDFAFADIVATVQFSDHTEGTLEVSGPHVCFSTHSRSALWLRVFPTK
jgi:hypothetical protein